MKRGLPKMLENDVKRQIKIAAIDPGPKESACLVWDGTAIESMGILSNESLLRNIILAGKVEPEFPLVIEKVVSYGMAVGESTFETVYWTGRFCQVWSGIHHRMPRLAVKQHLCHDSRAKDTNIRQALIDRFGPPGRKKDPGLTYGLKTHLWAAFALAVTWWDQNGAEAQAVSRDERKRLWKTTLR